MSVRHVVLLLTLVGAFGGVCSADGRAGKLYDPGIEMTARAPAAPAELDEVAYLVGNWDVSLELTNASGETHRTSGVAAISYMNRGHAIMERLFVDAFDGDENDAHEIRFLAFNHGAKVWNLGEASSYSESARAMHGELAGGVLALYDAERPRGGPSLVLHRTSFHRGDSEGFVVVQEVSGDLGATFETRARRTYRKRAGLAPALALTRDGGSPAAGRPEGADGFDFLVGTFATSQWLLFGGREVSFPTNASAVYALGGHAILEFNWFDLDPNLPDAATTVLRIYNRAERQWESLFLTNRFNSILHFGGRQEGDRIVLTTYDVDSTATLSRFVFHEIEDDGYRWFAESSTDRGKNFKKTWTIDATRRKDVE